MESQIAAAFPTLLGKFSFPAPEGVNRALRQAILAREAREPDHPHSNVGGWHSGMDLFDWPDEGVATLREWVSQATNAMIRATFESTPGASSAPTNLGLHVYGWANVSRRGNYHSVHNHPTAAWSGVYYVDTGGPAPAEFPSSGVIDLFDPRPFTEMVTVPGNPYGKRFPVHPQPGMLLMFPGFLYHFVHPFQGEGTRISVAFNVRAQRSA